MDLIRKKIILFVFCFLTIGVYAQKDTEFWFACPDISEDDDKQCLCFVSFDLPTVVTISQPANSDPSVPSSFTPIIIPMMPNSLEKISLGQLKSIVETSVGWRLPYGLHISADNHIMAYYSNSGSNCELYTLKGQNALGTDFIIPMQFQFDITQNYGDHTSCASIQIVATEDSTEVEITPSATTEPAANSDGKIQIRLDKGWVYAIKAKGLAGKDHLGRTRITSNKPIAVNTTDDGVEPGDMIGDQLIPTDMAGYNYIAVKNDGGTERLYLFATEDTTTIYINGVKQSKILNINTKWVTNISQSALFVSADKPILVFQVTSSGGASDEMAGAILPAIDCTGSTEIAYQSIYDNPVIDIITKTANAGYFTVNGQSNVIRANDFKPIANTEWSYCRKKFDNSNEYLRIGNSAGYFHAGVYDRQGWACGFAYFSDYRAFQMRTAASKSYYLAGDTLRLDMFDAVSFSDIVWTTPDGETIQGNPLIVPNATAKDAGLYTVSGTYNGNCEIIADNGLLVNIFDPVISDTAICAGSTTELTATGYEPYSWAPDETSTAQTIYVSPEESTNYVALSCKAGQNILYNGDFQIDTLNFESDYHYQPTGLATTETFAIKAVADEANSHFFHLYDHTVGTANGRFLIANCSTLPGVSIWRTNIQVQPNQSYVISAWLAAAGESTPVLCYAINGEISKTDIIPTTSWKQFEYIWNSGSRTIATLCILTGTGNTQAGGIGIDDIEVRPLYQIPDTFNINIKPLPTPTIGGDEVLCNGMATLETDSGYSSYRWTKTSSGEEISTQSSCTVNEAGNYQLEVTDSVTQCTGSTYFNIKEGVTVNILLNEAPVICSDQPDFALDYHLLSGNVTSYSVQFNSEAIAAGFTNQTDVTATNGEIRIVLPNNVRPDIYHAQLTLLGEAGCGGRQSVATEFTVRYAAHSVMAQKWDDVLALYNNAYNGGYTFTAYQWYKNGLPLEGQTYSYLYLGEEQLSPNDQYCVLLTRDDGVTLFSCDFTPEIRKQIPAIVSPGQILTLSTELQGTATFYTLNGWQHSTQTIRSGNSEIIAPRYKGAYVLCIKTAETQYQYKLLVR